VKIVNFNHGIKRMLWKDSLLLLIKMDENGEVIHGAAFEKIKEHGLAVISSSWHGHTRRSLETLGYKVARLKEPK